MKNLIFLLVREDEVKRVWEKGNALPFSAHVPPPRSQASWRVEEGRSSSSFLCVAVSARVRCGMIEQEDNGNYYQY